MLPNMGARVQGERTAHRRFTGIWGGKEDWRKAGILGFQFSL